MKTYQVNKEGYYGEFGGAYIPEILHRCVEELKNAYSKVLESEGFKKEFHQLLHDYVGRPSPLYLANRLSEQYGCKIYLKREDLNTPEHTKSTMPSARCYWQNVWGKNVSLQKPELDSMVWPPPRYAL